MINKKAFLLAETTLKIVIALISIGILIYFLASLYISNQNEKDLILAKASLEHLVEQINADSTQVEIYNPKDWVIVSFPYDVRKWIVGTKKVILPENCKDFKSGYCVCICKLPIATKQGEKCDEIGTCAEVPANTFVKAGTGYFDGNLIITPPHKLKIQKINNEIYIENA